MFYYSGVKWRTINQLKNIHVIAFSIIFIRKKMWCVWRFLSENVGLENFPVVILTCLMAIEVGAR